jgi:hypothetical protein
VLLSDEQRFRQSASPGAQTARLHAGFRQQAKITRPPRFRSRRARPGETFLYLRNPLFVAHDITLAFDEDRGRRAAFEDAADEDLTDIIGIISPVSTILICFRCVATTLGTSLSSTRQKQSTSIE